MDESTTVLARLERIRVLEREGAPARALLAEVRELFAEAEAWIEAEPSGTERAAAALERCRDALAAREAVVMT